MFELLGLAIMSGGLFGAKRYFTRRIAGPTPPPARRYYYVTPSPWDEEPDWARWARLNHMRNGITAEDVRRYRSELPSEEA